MEDMSCLKEEDGETDEERNMEDAHGVLGKNGGRKREIYNSIIRKVKNQSQF